MRVNNSVAIFTASFSMFCSVLVVSCKGSDSVKMPEQDLFNLTHAQLIKNLQNYTLSPASRLLMSVQ
jgi:hypothetical protein